MKSATRVSNNQLPCDLTEPNRRQIKGLTYNQPSTVNKCWLNLGFVINLLNLFNTLFTFVCLPLLIALTLAKFGHFDFVEQKRGDVEKPTETFLEQKNCQKLAHKKFKK